MHYVELEGLYDMWAARAAAANAAALASAINLRKAPFKNLPWGSNFMRVASNARNGAPESEPPYICKDIDTEMELSISVSHVEWIVDGVRMSLKARLNQFATHTSRIVSLSYHCSMCDILRANCLAKMGPALVFFEHDKNFLYEILDATLVC